MPSPNVQVVMNVFGGGLAGGGADLLELFTNSDVVSRLPELFDPAPIEFPTPDGGQLGLMDGPFFGAAGLRQAWEESEPLGDVPDPRGAIRRNRGARLAPRALRWADVRLRARNRHSVAAIYEIEDGKVVRLRHYLDQNQARAAAGLIA